MRQRGPIFGDIITPARKHARLAGPDFCLTARAPPPSPSCYIASQRVLPRRCDVTRGGDISLTEGKSLGYPGENIFWRQALASESFI